MGSRWPAKRRHSRHRTSTTSPPRTATRGRLRSPVRNRASDGRSQAPRTNRNCRSKACSGGSGRCRHSAYPHARRRTGDQPARDRAAWADVAGVARAARRRHRVGRHDGRADGDPVRARARPGRQGRSRHDVAEGHRLRDGGHRRPHPGPDPGAFGDRRRGTEPPTSTRRAGRPVGGAGGEDVDRPARRRDRQGHRRPGSVPRPRHDAPPVDRRRDGRREVERPQLHHHVAADAQHPRPGAPHPDRPEAGRDGPVPTAAAPADAAGHQPQEGGQRARLGREGDGPPLRHPVGGRVPRHHRLQRRVRPWRGRGRAAQRRRVPTPAVHRDRRRRAQRLDDGGGA